MIRPTRKVEMFNPEHGHDVPPVLHLQETSGLVVVRLDLEEGHEDVPYPYGLPCPLREIRFTLLLVSLYDLGQHDYVRDSLLPQHLPELQHCLLFRRLCRDE